MITYEWSFPNFECDSENVVKTIDWRYTAVDGEYSASMYGSCAEIGRASCRERV